MLGGERGLMGFFSEKEVKPEVFIPQAPAPSAAEVVAD